MLSAKPLMLSRLVAPAALLCSLTWAGAPASAQAISSTSVPNTSCAWPSMLSAQTSDAALPDSAAFYWLEPLVGGTATKLVISGRYPDARYASLSVYTPYGSPVTVNGVGSSLPDYRIEPEPGSTNPWQEKAPAGGSFKVTVMPDVSPGEPNVLPFPPGTTALHPGYLLYRVYLPAGGSSSGVQLPALTLDQGAVARALPACPVHDSPVPRPEPAPSTTTTSASGSPGAQPPAPGEFYKPGSAFYAGGLANSDASYLEAYLVRPQPADVVVISAKAPTFPPGAEPSPWPKADEDVRYWSICIAELTRTVPTVANKLPNGQTDYGCRADQVTAINAAGDFVYVIGSEAQRAEIGRVAGATFLPFATDQTSPLYILLWREVLVSPQFTHSPQEVGPALDPAAAAAVMGSFYPRTWTCPLATLVAKGLGACESGSSRGTNP